MELILRYALFESFFLKAIGNILWEYEGLLGLPIHKPMVKEDDLDRHRRRLRGNPSRERISTVKTLVDTIDRLHFAKWKNERPRKLYVWQYLRDGLGLEFGQEKICASLEWVRRVRNHVVHSSLELTIMNERLAEAEKCLAAFPLLLVQAGIKKYPKACTEDPPEEGEEGTPGYVFAEEYF